jgi:hypothetical protein
MEDTIKKMYEANNIIMKEYPIIKDTCKILEAEPSIMLFGYQLDERIHRIYEKNIFTDVLEMVDPNFKKVNLSDETVVNFISCFMTMMWHKDGENSHFFTEDSSEFLNEPLNKESLKSINNIKCSTLALDIKKGNLPAINDEVAGTVWIEAALVHLIRDPDTKLVNFVDTILLLNPEPEKPLEYEINKPTTVLYGTTGVENGDMEYCTALNKTILKALVYISKNEAPVKLTGNKYFYDKVEI